MTEVPFEPAAQDVADLDAAVDQFRTMFGNDPEQFIVRGRPISREAVIKMTAELREICALAYEAWVENDRQPLPDDIAYQAAEWVDRTNGGVTA